MDEGTAPAAASGNAKPWGFWGTTGWGLVAFVAYLGTQVVAVFVSLIATGGYGLVGKRLYANPEERVIVHEMHGAETLLTNGFYIAVATIVGGFVGATVLWAVVRRRFVVRDYLSLRWPQPRTVILWILAAAGFWAAFDALALLLDRPMPRVMVDVYATARSPALLFVAVVVFAPLFEEMFFRGFLFRGWSRSRLGIAGTIALTAVLWAALHVHYGTFEISGLVLYGALLGVARHRTGSLLVPLLLHALTNAVAFAQMAWSATAS